jgi:uncharacterized protein (TIRG00374 family)
MAEAILAVKNIYLKHRDLFLLVTKIITAAGLLTFILYSVNINRTVTVFENSDKFFLSAAFILSFVNIYLQYLKWKLVCGCIIGENERSKIINSLFYGFTAGSFTPARIGEYVGRALPFTEKPLLQITSAVFIDKAASLLIVLLIGSVSFLFFINAGIQYILIIITLLILLSFVLMKAAFLTPFLKKIINRYSWSKELFSGFSILKTSSGGFKLKLIFLSLLFYICFIIQFALLVTAFSHQNNFFEYIWSGNLVMFAKTIIPPVSFGELGIREGASVYFLKQVGVSAAAGFNAAIFLFIINVLLPALTGLIFLLKRK